MAKELNYEVKAEIGELSESKKLRVISWDGREAKIDLRTWVEKDGEVKAGKGITLTNDEAKKLVELLSDYLNDDEDEDF